MTIDIEGKRTPLYAMHCQLGARLIQFGGWEMPVSYSGIIEEHQRVRTHAGLFDVSHMGEIEMSGPRAEAAAQYLTLNDVRSLQTHQLQYSALCNEAGGLLDDLTVCRLAADRFLLIVNAANIDKDFRWITQHMGAGVRADNRSDTKALLALQGPEAETILQRLSATPLGAVPYYSALVTHLDGHAALVSRTGYTGEDGFEVLVDAANAVAYYQIGQGRVHWPRRPDPPEGGWRATPHGWFYHARTWYPAPPLPSHAGRSGHWRGHQWHHVPHAQPGHRHGAGAEHVGANRQYHLY